MTDEADLDELAGLAAALTGDADLAARLVGATLANRAARRAPDLAALRRLLVQQYLRDVPSGPATAGGLPDELAAVAVRLDALRPVDRAAVVLVRLVDLTLGETAGTLDQTPTRLRQRLVAAESALGADPLTIRATLEALSWRVPAADAVAAARYRAEQAGRRRRGRVRLVSVVVGAALAAAITVPTVRMLTPLPVRSEGDWAFAVNLEPPPGWRTDFHAVTADQEFLQLSDPEAGECSMVASLPSAPSRRRVAEPEQSERAWVDGRPVRISERYGQGTGVRWSYANGGEATLICSDQKDPGLVRDMAGRLRFSTGQRMALPVALDRLPQGMQLLGAGYDENVPIIALTSDNADIRIRVAPPDISGGRTETIGGVEYRRVGQRRSVLLCRTVQTLDVCISADGDTSAARRVAEVIRLAPDLRDRSTWFDARAAIPS